MSGVIGIGEFEEKLVRARRERERGRKPPSREDIREKTQLRSKPTKIHSPVVERKAAKKRKTKYNPAGKTHIAVWLPADLVEDMDRSGSARPSLIAIAVRKFLSEMK